MTNTKTRSRRKFTAEFKARVAMEALQERLRALDTRHLQAAISSRKMQLDKKTTKTLSKEKQFVNLQR